MTNRFNKHDFNENQAKLHFLTCLKAASKIFFYYKIFLIESGTKKEVFIETTDRALQI